jgi:RHS repeat-associated protein
MGRRIYKSLSTGGTSVFAYDGDNMIEETNSSGAVVARYEQGQSIDEPLAMLRSSTTSYYNADGLGSVTSLANGSGTLTESYNFDSFGKTTPTGSVVNPFQYTGREMDTETGLYFDRTRYYDPSVGRFLSEDTIQFEGGNNFYAYVENNSVIWDDPFGRAHCTYNIASHQFHCISDDGTQTFDTVRVRSGVGPKCMNIPTCANVPNKGPIPPGQYSMGRLGGTPNPHKIPRVYLTPKAGTNTFGRSAFEVHPGGDNSSEGCITLDFDEYDKWRRFYSKDNHGDLKVQ